MKNFIDIYINVLQDKNLITNLESVKISYVLTALKSELIKMSLLSFIFLFLGYITPFLFTLLMILPIRVSTGGFHFSTNIHCFLCSLLFFALSVIFLPQLALQSDSYLFLLLVSSMALVVLPLAPSKKRPIISKKKYLQNKYFSLIYLMAFLFIYIFFLKNQYFIQCGIWALFLQALQLAYIQLIHILRRNTYV